MVKACFFAVAVITAAASAVAQVKISEVWPWAGSTPDAPNADFVELFNAGPEPQDLAGWTLHVSNSSGIPWEKIALKGTIQPSAYFLIQITNPVPQGVALPPPDVTAALGFSELQCPSGVALLSSLENVPSCPSNNPLLVDLAALCNFSCREGQHRALQPSSHPPLSISRKCDGWDTEQNASDFELRAPTPRNSASGPHDPLSVAFSPAVEPIPLRAEDRVALFVKVDICDSTSTGGTVIVDLSSIGGSPAQAMLDDGIKPDLVAGDYVFTTVTDPVAPAGTYWVPYYFADAQGRSANAWISLNVWCRADLDGDGDVDRSDLGVLLAAYGVTGNGDLDGDNETGQVDLGILLADWGCN